ncbi:MAG: 4'-phosphopantetheinyl transferase superfamily protein [Betaproteobacteria bacterium]|nr:4'-phosphopantetheinyl transferase superfamily protein [Betaproteobacteria bacterium]
MTESPPAGERCGIDTVAIDRVERMLDANDAASIARLFTARELADAGEGPGRAASLAARFAAKEACLKLFPRETALEAIAASDFRSSATTTARRRSSRARRPRS